MTAPTAPRTSAVSPSRRAYLDYRDHTNRCETYHQMRQCERCDDLDSAARVASYVAAEKRMAGR